MPRPVTPLLTVDVVIELLDRPGEIVLIERAHEPLGFALPGGFVDVGETVEQAAVREVREETGLTVTLIDLLGVYSDPARDRRGHTVSVVFVGRAHGVPTGGDDAKHAGGYRPERPPLLAFDHAKIIDDYLNWRREDANKVRGC
jgi:8-oxo-dGTP diphosphatase